MAKIHELPQTRNDFEIRGIVTGMGKEKTYVDGTTKTGKQFRRINFGVTYDENKTLYVQMNGFKNDFIYLYKKGEGTKSVAWDNRYEDNDGFNVIGIGCKYGSEKKTLVEYDAAKYIYDNFKDGDSVYVRGNIEHDSYKTNTGDVVRTTKLIIKNIYTTKNEVDFENDEIKNNFTQTIVFTDIAVDADEKDTFILEGKAVGYNNIENCKFVVRDKSLATNIKKNLKPYNSIEVSGKIDLAILTEEIDNDDDDVWGERNTMKVINAPTKREFVITGAVPSSIDRETYTEKNIKEALNKINGVNDAVETFADNDDDDAYELWD